MQMCIIHYFSDVSANVNARHCRPLIQVFLNLARWSKEGFLSKDTLTLKGWALTGFC